MHEQALRGHIRFLASDLLEGRGPGSTGDELAHHYIAAQFESLGLKILPAPVPLVHSPFGLPFVCSVSLVPPVDFPPPQSLPAAALGGLDHRHGLFFPANRPFDCPFVYSVNFCYFPAARSYPKFTRRSGPLWFLSATDHRPLTTDEAELADIAARMKRVLGVG